MAVNFVISEDCHKIKKVLMFFTYFDKRGGHDGYPAETSNFWDGSNGCLKLIFYSSVFRIYSLKTASSHFYLSIIKYIKNLHFANLVATCYFHKWRSHCHSLQKIGSPICIRTTLPRVQQDYIEFLKQSLIGRNKLDHVIKTWP